MFKEKTTMKSIKVTTDLTGSGDTLHRTENLEPAFITVEGVKSALYSLSLYCVDHDCLYCFDTIKWVKDKHVRAFHRKHVKDKDVEFILVENHLDVACRVELNKAMFPLSREWKRGSNTLPMWKIKYQGFDSIGHPNDEILYSDPFVIKSKRPIRVQDAQQAKKGVVVHRKKRKRICHECVDLKFKCQKNAEVMLTLQHQNDNLKTENNNIKQFIYALHDLIHTHPNAQESTFLQTALRISTLPDALKTTQQHKTNTLTL